MDRVWNTRKGFLGKEVVRAREMATMEGIMTGTTPKHRREARISCSDFADCRGLGSGPIRESLITPELLRGQQCRFALRRHHTRALFSISDIELRLLQSVGGGEHRSFRQVPRDLWLIVRAI